MFSKSARPGISFHIDLHIASNSDGILTSDVMDNLLRGNQEHVVVVKEEDFILLAALVGLVLSLIVSGQVH